MRVLGDACLNALAHLFQGLCRVALLLCDAGTRQHPPPSCSLSHASCLDFRHRQAAALAFGRAQELAPLGERLAIGACAMGIESSHTAKGQAAGGTLGCRCHEAPFRSVFLTPVKPQVGGCGHQVVSWCLPSHLALYWAKTCRLFGVRTLNPFLPKRRTLCVAPATRLGPFKWPLTSPCWTSHSGRLPVPAGGVRFRWSLSRFRTSRCGCCNTCSTSSLG